MYLNTYYLWISVMMDFLKFVDQQQTELPAIAKDIQKIGSHIQTLTNNKVGADNYPMQFGNNKMQL